MITSVRFGGVYRLVDNRQPLTDGRLGRKLAARLHAKDNSVKYYEDTNHRGDVRSIFIVDGADANPFQHKLSSWLGKATKSLLNMGVDQQRSLDLEKQRIVAELASKAVDRDIKTI